MISTTYTITNAKPPEPIGYWVLDFSSFGPSTMFAIYKKPTDIQIKNTEETFGWKWKDK